ncbi:MAG TPA: GTPase [Ktedonobacteraceae bacterium]
MAKQPSEEFNAENDAQGADDTLVILPEEESEDEPLVLLPEDTELPVPQNKLVKLPDEKNAQKKIADRTVKTGWKKRNSPPDWRKLGIDSLTKMPANIALVRSFMQAINWKQAQEEVLEGLGNTVVIVGQANTGKSTLFNHLKGKPISEVSPQAGTTKSLIRTDFGPFTLVDTPGHLPDVMEMGIEQSSLVVFMIDGEKGLRPDDRNLLMTIRELEKPTIVVVNKIDSLKNTQAGDDLANNIAMRLGVTGVIPISARNGTNIAEELVPAMITASPEAALVIGRELPAFRRQAAQRIIRNATLISLAAGLEPIPLIDIPILIGTQVRLVLRLAALYGEPIDSSEALKNVRELVVTMIGGLGLRYLAEQAAKAVPFGGDIIAGAIAGAATWSIGEVALEYYEGGKRLSVGRLRTLTNSFYKRFRKQEGINYLRKHVIEEESKPLMLEAERPGNDKRDLR